MLTAPYARMSAMKQTVNTRRYNKEVKRQKTRVIRKVRLVKTFHNNPVMN